MNQRSFKRFAQLCAISDVLIKNCNESRVLYYVALQAVELGWYGWDIRPPAKRERDDRQNMRADEPETLANRHYFKSRAIIAIGNAF